MTDAKVMALLTNCLSWGGRKKKKKTYKLASVCSCKLSDSFWPFRERSPQWLNYWEVILLLKMWIFLICPPCIPVAGVIWKQIVFHLKISVIVVSVLHSVFLSPQHTNIKSHSHYIVLFFFQILLDVDVKWLSFCFVWVNRNKGEFCKPLDRCLNNRRDFFCCFSLCITA